MPNGKADNEPELPNENRLKPACLGVTAVMRQTSHSFQRYNAQSS